MCDISAEKKYELNHDKRVKYQSSEDITSNN